MTKIAARRAAVRPRVHVPGSTVAHLLEDVVRETLRTHFEGVIEIIGGPGMGKTTALEHLADVLTPAELFNVRFYDEPDRDEIRDWTPGLVHICTKKRHIILASTILSVTLIGWSEDDAIEYLLAKHHDQCGSVMSRINGSEENQIEYHLLVGCPQTIALLLDQMAEDESLISVKQCVWKALSELIPEGEIRKLSGESCLYELLRIDHWQHKVWNKLQEIRAWKELNNQTNQLPRKLLRFKYIQTLLAAEELVRELTNDEMCHFRNPQTNTRLTFEASRLIERGSLTEQKLLQLLTTHVHQALHPLAASLLNFTGRGWRPSREPIPNLRGAILQEMQLPEENLCNFDFSEAVLFDADLMYAQLDSACLVLTNLVDANLSHASLSSVNGSKAHLRRTNLANARGDCSSWLRAKLCSANLEAAQFNESRFSGADLSAANFNNASLRGSIFIDANISGTNFAGADLTSADLRGLDLTLCNLSGACFDSANLSGCHLEGVNLPEANFQNANLTNTYWTDSILPGGNFQNAILRGGGLAGIEWEGANLSGADLRESTFHMGSSRSGLVDSFLASEGTRTGFYTDDYEEQYFKSPEEIRKANLRGADLRGANITDVDFYLVDLRDAQIDDNQRAQLETTGAILFDRD